MAAGGGRESRAADSASRRVYRVSLAEVACYYAGPVGAGSGQARERLVRKSPMGGGGGMGWLDSHDLPWAVAMSLQARPSSLLGLFSLSSPSLRVPFCVSLRRTFVVGCRAHPNPQ